MNENAAKKIFDGLKEINGNITLGVDGCVDEVWKVVETRTGLHEYNLYNKMERLGEAIVKCKEGGFAHEIIRVRRSYGGFTSNTGNAIGRLGLKPVMVGVYGEDAIDPVFEPLSNMGDLISIGFPAVTQIFEFEDGKMMFGCLEGLLDFNWDSLRNSAEFNRVEEAFLNSDIIALGYWSSMPSFDELVSKVCEGYIEAGKCKKMFFDFADLRKRDKKSLEYTLKHLASLNEIVPMILSLNENEAEILFSYYGKTFDERNMEKALVDVREKVGISEIIVHTPYVAAASNDKEGFAIAQNRYCQHPVITTGAGDTFNGGYLAAALGMLDIGERLITGNATTAFYVRNGYAPNITELITEINALK